MNNKLIVGLNALNGSKYAVSFVVGVTTGGRNGFKKQIEQLKASRGVYNG